MACSWRPDIVIDGTANTVDNSTAKGVVDSDHNVFDNEFCGSKRITQ